MVRIWLGNALLAAMIALGGCTASHDTSHDTGEPCGPATCNPGLVCCNESCGICVAPGSGCPAIHCLPDDGGLPWSDAGAAIDAGQPGVVCGSEICGLGSHCCPGCEPGQESCRPLDEPCYGLCPPPTDAGTGGADGGAQSCGGRTGAPCPPGQFCNFGAHCGATDLPGTCQVQPEACIEPACREVCGCDGNTYCSECEAHSAGVSVLHEGACASSVCDAMDAGGAGLCDAFLGYAWNGTACVGLSGCDCVGSDCGGLFADYSECTTAYESCIEDCRTTGCDSGSTCQLCWFDYACVPDGAVC